MTDRQPLVKVEIPGRETPCRSGVLPVGQLGLGQPVARLETQHGDAHWLVMPYGWRT
jgi:hypothetical protein